MISAAMKVVRERGEEEYLDEASDDSMMSVMRRVTTLEEKQRDRRGRQPGLGLQELVGPPLTWRQPLLLSIETAGNLADCRFVHDPGARRAGETCDLLF
jgi:hypothetical protein